MEVIAAGRLFCLRMCHVGTCSLLAKCEAPEASWYQVRRWAVTRLVNDVIVGLKYGSQNLNHMYGPVLSLFKGNFHVHAWRRPVTKEQL